MHPNWADITLAIATSLTAIISFCGFVVVVYQIRQLSRSISSSTSERLMSESLEILRFLADHDGIYEYFYDNKECPAKENHILNCATEMVANYMEHIVLQMTNLPKDAQESWKKYVEDTYKCSPVVREHLRKNEGWYQPCLREMIQKIIEVSEASRAPREQKT